MAEQEQTVEELTSEWWAKWWEADYSWAGLARKRWRGWSLDENGKPTRTVNAPEGARPASLQDLWRSEELHLIKEPGSAPPRLWTRVHAPLVWKNGRRAKRAWGPTQVEEIGDAIDSALSRLPPSSDDPVAASKTRRARIPLSPYSLGSYNSAPLISFAGCVLPSIPRQVDHMPVFLATQAAFYGEVHFSKNVKSVDARDCLFNDFTSFRIRGEELRFSRSIFISDVEFSMCQLKSMTFLSTIFLSDISFNSVEVYKLSAFTRASFLGEVSFHDINMSDTRFIRSSLNAAASFKIGKINKLDFSLSKPISDISFESINISESNFERLRFGGQINTYKSTFENVNFRGSVFDDDALFTETIFGQFDFSSSRFSNGARFTKATFGSRMNFSRAVFEDVAYFDEVEWPELAADYDAAFREARFEAFADFRSDSFHAFSAFDGAAVKSEARFSRSAFAKDEGFKRALSNSLVEKQLESLEHGLRALRGAASGNGDSDSEHRFYRYELKSRSRQKSIGFGEKLLSSLYGISSNYGISLMQPIIVAFLIWVSFSAIYLVMGICSGASSTEGLGWGGPIHPATLEALGLSGRSMFNLFGVWSARPLPELGELPRDRLDEALLWGASSWGLLTRLASSVQSVLAGILLFLAGLSVRRRFQIN